MTKPSVEIHYCPKCNWLPRSAWMAQELLATFAEELASVKLVPAEQSGLFRILVDGRLVWDRKAEGEFPQIKELKQRVRNIVAPDKPLGHVDR